MKSLDIVIAGCKKGDRKSQEQLYRIYYVSMVRLCMRYTKNEQDAVEVLNNGFLKVFRYINRYEPGKATLYTWVRTIVIHCCIDFLQLKARNVSYEQLPDESGSYHIDAEPISKMQVNELLQFIRQLPEATMVVFNLYVIEGFTHKEIAALIHISEGTSKWHLSDARKKLQHMIQCQEVKL